MRRSYSRAAGPGHLLAGIAVGFDRDDLELRIEQKRQGQRQHLGLPVRVAGSKQVAVAEPNSSLSYGTVDQPGGRSGCHPLARRDGEASLEESSIGTRTLRAAPARRFRWSPMRSGRRRKGGLRSFDIASGAACATAPGDQRQFALCARLARGLAPVAPETLLGVFDEARDIGFGRRTLRSRAFR